MMKKNKNDIDIDNDFAKLAKGVGGEILDDQNQFDQFIDTNILSINYLISGRFVGGGLPVGCCAEIFGDSSSGKTLFGTNLLRGCQTANGIPVFLDAERTLSKDFAVLASHVDPKKLLVVEADTLERSFAKIHKVIRQARLEAKIPLERPIVIVYDSIAVSPSEREFAETTIDLENASKAEIKEAGAGADKPGERAKICSKELRKLPPILAENNTSILFINQVRSKIGICYGDPTVTAGGGRGLEFYASTRLRTSSFKHIKDNLGNTIGVNVSVRNVKNKCFRPFVEVKGLRLFFNKGIDPFGGLLELFLQDQRIETVSAGNYIVKEPYCNGKVIKFKSSKERNDVPAEVLLECPALVDAKTPEQVMYYVNIFGSAIEAVNNDVGSEVDITPEE